ncbi:aminopeptidase [Kwoniella heveanensis CBS 569]|nr:aminopeptidase [Kwoniella heveanensis CBS 569]
MASLLPLLAILGASASASASVIPSNPSAQPPTTVLISSSSPAEIDLSSCLHAAYFGTYGGSRVSQDHLYIPSEECLNGAANLLDGIASGSLVPLQQEQNQDADVRGGSKLVWVGQAGVDPSLLSLELAVQSMGDSWNIISSRSAEYALLHSRMTREEASAEAQAQIVLSSSGSTRAIGAIKLLHQSASSLLLHVPSAYLPMIDTFLPSHLVPVALPSKPFPSSQSASISTSVTAQEGWEPVPTKFAKNLANITKHLEFSPEIDRIVSDGIELNQIRRDVRWLTGEAPSGIQSRHSFTPGAVKAAHWIKDKVSATGANCTLSPFLPGFAPNVICHYPSKSNATTSSGQEHVILSAHYDSRGSFGSTRAPGGDDDGSGSGHLLAVAHAIGTQGVKFDKSVTLAFFAGEEQGLLGSHAYAEYLHGTNATVLLQIQADMLAYHVPGEPLQLGLPESIHLPEASYLLGNLSQLYSPELLIGKTAACCSDHQSFLSYGFPATAAFERNGWIADPFYHNSGDLSQREGYDFEQVVSIAKVTLASLLTVAGYTVVN